MGLDLGRPIHLCGSWVFPWCQVSNRYEIKTIDDLLRVPPERLHDCLAELETSIQICHAMAALASAGISRNGIGLMMGSVNKF